MSAESLSRLMGLAENRLIDHIPDDAFFYLQTARTFARTGRWSFDGVEPASGFHVLWGYLLAGLYRVRPGITLRGVFGVAGLVGKLHAEITSTEMLKIEMMRKVFNIFSPQSFIIVHEYRRTSITLCS